MKYSSGQCLISLTVGFDLAYSHIITYFENSVITVRFESIVFTSVSPEIIIQVLLIEMACGAKLDCSPESKNFLVQACFVYLITNCNGVSHLMQKNFVIIWMRSLYFWDERSSNCIHCQWPNSTSINRRKLCQFYNYNDAITEQLITIWHSYGIVDVSQTTESWMSTEEEPTRTLLRTV